MNARGSYQRMARQERKRDAAMKRCGTCSGMAGKIRRLEEQLQQERQENRARERSILERAESYRGQLEAVLAKVGTV